MGMPEQVRRQQQVVEEFDKKVAADKAAATTVEPEPTPTPPAEPTPAPTPAPTPPEDAALWKQRFLSLQGMFNHQVPQLQNQVKSLMGELKALQEQLAERNKAPTPAPADTSTTLVTDQDVTAFGADLVDMVRRAGREEAAKITAAQVAEMAELKRKLAEATQHVTQVTQTQAKTAEESFFTKLDERLPEWEALQASDQCQAWLLTRVPGATHTWDDTIKGAAARRDADGVLEVFEEFFKNHPAMRPGTKAPTPPAPSPSNRAELARQVTPTKTTAAAPTPDSQPRMYTSKEYADESMKVIRLAQKGQFKEASALEAELNAALAQGRVKPT